MSSWITTCSFRHSQRVVQSWIPQVVTSCSPKHSLGNPAPYKIQESKPVLRGVQYPAVLGISLGTLNPTSYPESKWYPVQQSLLRERPARILYQERSSLYSVSLRRTYSNPYLKHDLSRISISSPIYICLWVLKTYCNITILGELSALSVQLSEAPGPSITMVSTIRSLYTWEVLQTTHHNLCRVSDINSQVKVILIPQLTLKGFIFSGLSPKPAIII